MAYKRKYYLTCRFKTIEDFDKHFHSIWDRGVNHGIKEGRVELLAEIFMLLEDGHFTDEEIGDAQYLARKMKIARWRKKQELYESIKKQAVEEYKKKLAEGKETETSDEGS